MILYIVGKKDQILNENWRVIQLGKNVINKSPVISAPQNVSVTMNVLTEECVLDNTIIQA